VPRPHSGARPAVTPNRPSLSGVAGSRCEACRVVRLSAWGIRPPPASTSSARGYAPDSHPTIRRTRNSARGPARGASPIPPSINDGRIPWLIPSLRLQDRGRRLCARVRTATPVRFTLGQMETDPLGRDRFIQALRHACVVATKQPKRALIVLRSELGQTYGGPPYEQGCQARRVRWPATLLGAAEEVDGDA
jgi:hypothetical protein